MAPVKTLFRTIDSEWRKHNWYQRFLVSYAKSCNGLAFFDNALFFFFGLTGGDSQGSRSKG
jgi:hypothetical protein